MVSYLFKTISLNCFASILSGYMITSEILNCIVSMEFVFLFINPSTIFSFSALIGFTR